MTYKETKKGAFDQSLGDDELVRNDTLPSQLGWQVKHISPRGLIPQPCAP